MSALPWLIAGGSALTAAFFFWMWRRQVKDSVHLTEMILLLIFTDGASEVYRPKLVEWIKQTRYQSAEVLSGMVSMWLSKLAKHQAQAGNFANMRQTTAALWALSKEGK